MTEEEMVVCAMADAKEFQSGSIPELAAAVVKEIVTGDTESLRQAAARILRELNRRAQC